MSQSYTDFHSEERGLTATFQLESESYADDDASTVKEGAYSI